MQTSGLGLAAGTAEPGGGTAAAADEAGAGGGGGTRTPRPRNKMGRRPSWSEAEVLAAVQSLLEHPEGNARGPEAQAAWHERLRNAFMTRFRQLAATNPTLAAREEVWANRSARKIISEARSALNNCRVLHAGKVRGAEPEEFAYPAVYDWLLRHTSEFHGFVTTSVVPDPALQDAPELEDAGVANAAAIAAVAAANPMPPRAPAVKPDPDDARRKRPRPDRDEDDRVGAKYAIMEAETRRQNSELAALRELFCLGMGANAAEVEEFKRLLRRNAIKRARIEVEIDMENAVRDPAGMTGQWRATGRAPNRVHQPPNRMLG